MSSTEENKKIFVIEDNKTEGMLLKLCLRSIKNTSITNFTTGEGSLDHINENPDIIITDLMLPDIEGYELVKKIRTKQPDTPIIVVSAQHDINLIAKLQGLGVFNYIVKSELCIEYLQNVIKDLLILIEYKKKNEA